jgi:hypothetical protein
MKNLRSILVTLAVLLIATAAQAQQTAVTAKIPFDFVVGNHAFTAGEYLLKSMNDSAVPIRLDNLDDSTAGIVMSNACVDSQPATSTVLIFHHIGDNYFLYQVWTEGKSAGRQFPISRAEVQLAQNHQTERVIVAANFSH